MQDKSKARRGGNILEKNLKAFEYDAGRVAGEVIAHPIGIVCTKVKVTLEIEVKLPIGAPENIVRIVTENSRTLKFVSQGFEKE